jgi:AcrR family transcriptional regulator
MQASKNLPAVPRAPRAPAGKRQERAILTRQLLTDAARRIFARCGFDLTRVEDIAAAAGKTRGAFYANFRDKEDVFFAIFEEDKSRDIEEMTPRLSEALTPEDRVEALACHLLEVMRDHARMQLALEFKQYAIRHKRKQKRLADLYSAMRERCMETNLDCLLPEFARASAAERRTQSAQIGAILEGVALNCMFDEGALSDEQVLQFLRTNLRVAMGLPSQAC